MSDGIKKIVVNQTAQEVATLAEDNLRLQVSKKVKKPDLLPISNIVWQTHPITSQITISWSSVYGINWIIGDGPQSGLGIMLSGVWQPVRQGESYELGPQGTRSLTHEETYADRYFLVRNRYHEPIRVVIGIERAMGWDPIYVDPVSLQPGAAEEYEPHQSVQWWHQSGQRTGTRISKDGAVHVGGIFMHTHIPSANQREWFARFILEEGRWTYSPTDPLPTAPSV